MVAPGPPRQYPDDPAPRRKLAPSKRGYTSVTLPDSIYERLKPSPTNTIRQLLNAKPIPWDAIESALVEELGYIHRQSIHNSIARAKAAQEQS